MKFVIVSVKNQTSIIEATATHFTDYALLAYFMNMVYCYSLDSRIPTAVRCTLDVVIMFLGKRVLSIADTLFIYY
jgi:hypothetical protein